MSRQHRIQAPHRSVIERPPEARESHPAYAHDFMVAWMRADIGCPAHQPALSQRRPFA